MLSRLACAVAAVGWICYTFHRCSAMEGRMSALKQSRGIKTFSHPLNGLWRPRHTFYPFSGCDFCK